MGDINLIKDTTYRSWFQIDAPFVATKAMIRSEVIKGLTEQGFADVRVWMSASELPADWPNSAKGSVPGTTAWIEGRWTKETGAYPSSGDGWKAVNYWVHKPAPGSCNTEGWTCY